MRKFIPSVAVIAVVAGACVPIRPQVELAKGVSLSSYKVFEVAPVVDESNYPFFPFPIADSLRDQLAARLREHGLTVRMNDADSTELGLGTLVLRSTLHQFRGGDPNPRLPETRIASRCLFVTTLIDKHTGQRVGQVVAENIDNFMPLGVLMSCARMVGDELARRLGKG